MAAPLFISNLSHTNVEDCLERWELKSCKWTPRLSESRPKLSLSAGPKLSQPRAHLFGILLCHAFSIPVETHEPLVLRHAVELLLGVALVQNVDHALQLHHFCLQENQNLNYEFAT